MLVKCDFKNCDKNKDGYCKNISAVFISQNGLCKEVERQYVISQERMQSIVVPNLAEEEVSVCGKA